MQPPRQTYPPLHELRAWRNSQPIERRSLRITAKLFGVSKTELYRWESGRRRIPAEKVPAIAALTELEHHLLRPDVYLKVSVEELQAVG
jgi:hypothetical protein